MLSGPTIRFALFSSAVAATISALMVFWPLWLTSRGLDATEIGVLGAAGLWVRAGATPLLGMLADWSGKRRLVMLLLAGASLAICGLFIPAYGFLPILAISTAFGTFFWSILPLAESAVLQGGVDYGRVKIWGSGIFLVMTVVIGRVLVAAPPDTLLVLLLGGVIYGTIATLLWGPSAVYLGLALGGGIGGLFLMLIGSTVSVVVTTGLYRYAATGELDPTLFRRVIGSDAR